MAIAERRACISAQLESGDLQASASTSNHSGEVHAPGRRSEGPHTKSCSKAELYSYVALCSVRRSALHAALVDLCTEEKIWKAGVFWYLSNGINASAHCFFTMDSPEGSDYLNRNMLADESDPPAYTPQPLNAHRKRFPNRFDGVLRPPQQDVGREDRTRDSPLPPLPERPSEPSPAAMSPPAPQNMPLRPANLPARSKRMVLAVDFGTTYSGGSYTHRMYRNFESGS